MTTRPKNSEAQTLEQYRVAQENTTSQTQISTTMAEFGYDSETMAIGKALFNETRQAFDSNKKETDESMAAYKLASGKPRIVLQGLGANVSASLNHSENY